jgi:hypothetical protein
MPFAFSETQLEQIKTFASSCPRHLHSQYLHHVAELLSQDFDDADLWHAAHKALHESAVQLPFVIKSNYKTIAF